MPLPPGIYNGRGKAQLTGSLPLGRGFDWTKTTAAKIKVSGECAASRRHSMFQTLQQFQWLPQHSRTSPIRQYPPSSFSRTPASFLADWPGLKMPTKLQVIKDRTSPNNSNFGSLNVPSVSRPSTIRNCRQDYAHVLLPAGVRKSLAIEGGHVAPLRSANGHQGIWN